MTIEIQNINVFYKNGHEALHNASCQIPDGSITALLGVNGSGKTTLFRSIMGVLRINSGKITIDGQSPNVAIKNNLISYVPQYDDIDWEFPILVKDVVMMGRYSYMNFMRTPNPVDYKIVEESLKKVGMDDLINRQIGELSGGQKKRVFIARALAQESKILLLDEPFTGVDSKTQETILELIKQEREKNKIILISTHDLNIVPEICDRTILINKTVQVEGLTQEVFTKENLVNTFGNHLNYYNLNNG
ncbi:MAG: metal ABC transporter ATP-binding protein [Rhizobiales bacterium]|nr:manganese/iron transporter ATP-binding protein [Rhodobiaceae bacterium]MBL6624027.1 metal ABC transporter ATP-binding protein [Hyphomicrobiales bacterium]MBL6770725.1 metal ABC transporter ATP-binding protein [Hyphomicrobiales bacterium]RPF96573.1 MAG: metal ABC transporter ATP-binding protein [Rhizobiales bacterium TMED227]|tara:strand:+ start:404 stop:1144 length:741 start_codon:yes stop_codon:yes gene_type:complete